MSLEQYSIKNQDCLNCAWKEYRANKEYEHRWQFANSILYKMCEDYPEHNDADVIVAKMWLIGRSYSAAIERRKNADKNASDFYYEDVANEILKNGKELDEKIKNLNRKSERYLDELFELHLYFMNILNKLTGLDKRSLASKYLHFHCKNKVFIFDSTACKNIKKIVSKSREKASKTGKCENFDEEYIDFVMRVLKLKTYLEEKSEEKNEEGITPREIDTFLLNFEKIEKTIAEKRLQARSPSLLSGFRTERF